MKLIFVDKKVFMFVATIFYFPFPTLYFFCLYLFFPSFTVSIFANFFSRTFFVFVLNFFFIQILLLYATGQYSNAFYSGTCSSFSRTAPASRRRSAVISTGRPRSRRRIATLCWSAMRMSYGSLFASEYTKNLF